MVADQYVDNDMSASSGKRRPEYERMLSDLRDGVRDAVIVYHQDRLTRRPVELEYFVEVVEQAGVSEVHFVSGPGVNIGNGDGLMVLRIMGAMAANETTGKSRRVLRKMEEVAASGMPHGGSNRPFGYEDDKITIRPDEAELLRALVARYIAGESLRSLVTWLNDEGIPTVTGKPWKTPTLRGALRSGRLAGLREHRGEVVGKAVWDPIITEADRNRVLARMTDMAVTGRRTPRRYVLSGLVRCGRCENRLFSASRVNERRYVCLSGPDHGGCGGITVTAPPLEELVADAVLYRLDTSELADVLAGRASQDAEGEALHATVAADRAQLDELADVYADGDITMREWKQARRRIADRIEGAEKRLSRMSRSDALAGLVGNGTQLRGQWADLNLTRQHAIVRAVLDHVVINPGKSGAQSLDPNRVDLVWRL